MRVVARAGRSCAARAATCRRRSRCPCPRARPLLALRRRAQEHVLPRRAAGAPGSATTSATCELRDAALLPRRASRTSSGCSRSRPRSSRTTCTPTTSRRRYALEREGVELVARPAPPRAPRGVPGRARRDAGRRSGAIFDGTGLRPGRHGVGRRAAGRRPGRLRARRAPVPGPAAGRRRGGPRAVADGLRVARRRRGGEAPALPRRSPARGRPAAGRAVARLARTGARRRR